MCDFFDQTERRGEERGFRMAHQGAVRLFQRGSDMEFVKSIFSGLPPEDLQKALEESNPPQ